MTRAPIRVCHLVSGDAWGGAEEVVWNLVRHQADRDDVEVTAILLNDLRLAELIRARGIPVHVVQEEALSFPGLLRKVDRAIRELRPQIVHSHRYKENTLSYLLSPRNRYRCVVTLHGYEPPSALSARARLAVWRAAAQLLARLVGTRFVSVSADLRDILGLPPTRCEVIPNGVVVPDDPRANPSGVRAGADERASRTIGWMGRFVSIKGLPLLLDAVSLLVRRGYEINLLLVGDGPEKENLISRITDLGIEDRVELTGFVESPKQQLQRMDIFVLPSEHEGVPLSLLEAMALGIPSVASQVGGIPEVVRSGSDALLVEGRAPETWASELATLLDAPEACSAMGKRGRTRVIRSFSVERMTERYVEIYRNAMPAADP